MIFEHIEQEAERVLNQFSSKTIPVVIEGIAVRLSAKIRKAPSKDFSGLLIRKNGHALIGINSGEASVRQRFTIAHEIGHLRLHPNQDTFVDYRDNKKDVMRTPKERHADMFAAALLMPRQSLVKDFRTIAKDGFTEEEIELLARKYQVSDDAMRFRLLNLHLL